MPDSVAVGRRKGPTSVHNLCGTCGQSEVLRSSLIVDLELTFSYPLNLRHQVNSIKDTESNEFANIRPILNTTSNTRLKMTPNRIRASRRSERPLPSRRLRPRVLPLSLKLVFRKPLLAPSLPKLLELVESTTMTMTTMTRKEETRTTLILFDLQFARDVERINTDPPTLLSLSKIQTLVQIPMKTATTMKTNRIEILHHLRLDPTLFDKVSLQRLDLLRQLNLRLNLRSNLQLLLPLRSLPRL